MPRDQESKDVICDKCGQDLGETVAEYTHLGENYHKVVHVKPPEPINAQKSRTRR
jgi:hypothetical protein